jgi:hypothetical protein
VRSVTRTAPTSETVTLHVPLKLVRRGGRKEVVLPADAPVLLVRMDNTLVKALARAFRWQRMLETGAHATVADIALAERINPSYVSRILRLTLLAPDTVEAILEGRQEHELTLVSLLVPFPVEWERQPRRLMAADQS